jgi:hypothetical protein
MEQEPGVWFPRRTPNIEESSIGNGRSDMDAEAPLQTSPDCLSSCLKDDVPMGAFSETQRHREELERPDDPELSAATTARPPFRLSELAKKLEASGHRSTQPPEPSCEMLRDSCRTLRLADFALEEIGSTWRETEAVARRR